MNSQDFQDLYEDDDEQPYPEWTEEPGRTYTQPLPPLADPPADRIWRGSTYASHNDIPVEGTFVAILPRTYGTSTPSTAVGGAPFSEWVAAMEGIDPHRDAPAGEPGPFDVVQ